jgi:carboxyl-terminal processing protease
MKIFTKTFLITLIALILLSAAFAGGYLTHTYLSEAPVKLPILSEAYSLLLEHGYNTPPPQQAMEHGMIQGMLQTYGDRFSIFLEPAQRQLESDQLQGSFGGIGVRFGTDGENYPVLYPFPDSPALQAGIQDGDRLVAVGKLKIDPSTPLDDVQAAIRGKVGERVSLTIARPPGYIQQTLLIERKEIPLPSTTWHIEALNAQLGVIEVNVLAATTPDEIQKAYKDLSARGATHFVLDLRNNGGGLLDSGIDTARLFLKDGDIIQQQYRGKDVETFKVDKPGALADIPLAVLVNQNTASAAEIVAGSLQAHHRADLIGAPTFGKNTIQLVFVLQDGSSIHITAAHWWIPGLEFPKNGHGLEPDALLPADSKDANLPIETAIQELFNK